MNGFGVEGEGAVDFFGAFNGAFGEFGVERDDAEVDRAVGVVADAEHVVEFGGREVGL